MRRLVLFFVLGAMADACGAQAPAAHEERVSTGLARQGELRERAEADSGVLAERRAGNPPKDSGTAYHAEPKSPFIKPRFDSGWLARAHWISAAFDWSTTGLANRECLDEHYRLCGEADPIARPFVGRYPQPWRLGLSWAAESISVSFIPNRKVRRVVQISLIASHVVCGARNLSRWH